MLTKTLDEKSQFCSLIAFELHTKSALDNIATRLIFGLCRNGYEWLDRYGVKLLTKDDGQKSPASAVSAWGVRCELCLTAHAQDYAETS